MCGLLAAAAVVGPADGRQHVAELSQLGHAMPADPTRGPEAGWRQRA